MKRPASTFVTALAGATLLGGALVAVPAQAAETPEIGECLEYADLESLDSPGTSVACATEHNAEVFAVGVAPDDLGLPSQAFLPDQRRSELCTPPGGTNARAAMLDYLGLRDASIPLRTYFAVKLPTDEQWTAGDRWVRCLIAVNYQGTEVPVLFQSWSGSAPDRVVSSGAGWLLTCGDGTPASGSFTTIVRCDGERWALVANGVEVSGTAGTPYPGAALQAAADAACSTRVTPWLQDGATTSIAALVTREEWEAGGRVALCWIRFADWNGQVSDAPAPTPIPDDATLVVGGSTAAVAGTAQVYRVTAAIADDTPLPRLDASVTVTGAAALAGGGTRIDVTTGGEGYADVTIVAGKSGTFTVTAALTGAPTVTGSLQVTITAAPKPTPAISIRGKRATVSKKKGVAITGVTIGLAARASVVPHFQLAGQRNFTKAKAVKVAANGTFTWTRVAPKAITVYVTSGKVTSNRVTVR